MAFFVYNVGVRIGRRMQGGWPAYDDRDDINDKIILLESRI